MKSLLENIDLPVIEEYRPFGTLSNTDTFDYRAKLRYGRGLGLVSHKKRAKTVW